MQNSLTLSITIHRFSYFAYLVTSCLWACPQGKYLFGQTIYVGYVTVTFHYIRYYSVYMRCDVGIHLCTQQKLEDKSQHLFLKKNETIP